MRSRLGFVAHGIAATALLVALSGCQSDDPGTTAEFVGPGARELTVGYSQPCTEIEADNSDQDPVLSSRKGSVALRAPGFMPGSQVALEWVVPARDEYGTWEGVSVTADGDLVAQVKLPRQELRPGDRLEVWAQGEGPEGIAALSNEVLIGDC